jgi:RHH-type proline utilization regulon transcriptional repressor/proline dehydrogenase/delta 1-pyrroline-5-carboxylate dehydrogenase
MEQYSFKDLTLRIFREVLDESEFRTWPDVGIAIQAYLKDCLADLEHLRDWSATRGTSVWIRLVKGAYWDYETVVAAQQGWPTPVFDEKPATDANYEACTQFLIANHELLHPAFGSHNVRSLAYALACARDAGLKPGAYEIQMLYGMADPIKDALVGMGERVRVYTPYGQLLPGMAYLVRRLLENTANESFLRASFIDQLSEEHLLMKPLLEKKSQRNGKPAPLTAPGPFRNEPLADFSKAEVLQSMDQALAEVRKQLGRSYPAVLDAPRPSPMQVDSVNPSRNKEIVGRFSRTTKAMAEEAIAIAKAAFPAWRDTAVQRRTECLFKAAALMRKRRFQLAAWEVFECAKQRREADADVAEAIDFCEYYGREMLRLEKGQTRNVEGEENFYFYEPRGVAVVIAPWNFPLAILCGMTSAALAAGNTVIMKPAEQSSVVAAQLQEIWLEAGLPSGVVQFFPGIGEEIGPTLTNHPDVAIVAFTGSKPVGLAINHQASETLPAQDHVRRVIAEMGGKNAIIVDDDADLDEAVLGVVHSAFGYQGQKCSACSRAVVLDSVYDRFLARAIETTRSLRLAPAEDPGSVVGPVIDEEARRRILLFIAKGKEECKLAYAGELGALADEGFYVAPHIFADVDPKATIAQEEIFGPVLAVIRARDVDHALAIANGTRYALTGGLYSRSPERIARIKREFRVGNLYINRKITGALVDRQPFGGFKLSGIGAKAGGPDYLQQFLLTRTITENTLRRGFAPQAQYDQGVGE